MSFLPASTTFYLQELPSLVIKLIAESLKKDEKDQSLSNLTLTSKFVRAISAPVLWEVCEWNESYDWQVLFREGGDVLQYIRVLEIITLKWNHAADADENSWRLLSRCTNLSFLSIQSGDPVLLPSDNITFPNLVELELREYNYVEETDEAMYQRSRWQGPLTTIGADPGVSFPMVESLFVEGGTAVVHAMCDQLKHHLQHGGGGPTSVNGQPFEAAAGAAHAFGMVRRLTMWITVENMWQAEEDRSQVFALPEETFQLLGPNAIKLDVEQDSVWDDELDEIHQGRKVTLMSCMPTLEGLASLEELRLSVDIVSHAEYDDDCEVRVQLRETVSPTQSGKPKPSRKLKIHGENVRDVLPRLTKDLPVLAKVTLEWPLTFQAHPMAEKVDKIFSIVMKRGEGTDAELDWLETLELREDEPEVEEDPTGRRRAPTAVAASNSAITSATVFGNGPDGLFSLGVSLFDAHHAEPEPSSGPSTPAEASTPAGPAKPTHVNLGPSLKGINSLLRDKGL